MITLDEHMNSLEQEVAKLKALLGLSQPVKRDWESTVGMWKDDPLSGEVDRLGQKWTQSVAD